MMVAHLAAAALVALWLAHGERCLFSVLALTARLLLALVRPALPVDVPVVVRTSLTDASRATPLRHFLARSLRLPARPTSPRGLSRPSTRPVRPGGPSCVPSPARGELS